MTVRGRWLFNPPPQWPAPPPGWAPTWDWTPDPSWAELPPGWQLWIPDPAWVARRRRRFAGLALASAVWVVTMMAIVAVTLFSPSSPSESADGPQALAQPPAPVELSGLPSAVTASSATQVPLPMPPSAPASVLSSAAPSSSSVGAVQVPVPALSHTVLEQTVPAGSSTGETTRSWVSSPSPVVVTTAPPVVVTRAPRTPLPPVRTSTVTVPVVRPSTTDEDAAEVYYKNCAAAREAGVAPLLRGEPGYRPGLDRDDDGVACET